MILRLINVFSRAFFIAVVGLFSLFSVGLVAAAVWEIAWALTGDHDVLAAMLRSVGLVTIALAVFEVGKFLAEEELMRERELGSVREARYSLTKFMTLIIIVICIEAIVFVFEAKAMMDHRMLYPTLLLLVAVLALVALGLFQRLTRANSGGAERPDHRSASEE